MKNFRFDLRTKIFLAAVLSVMVMIFVLSQMSGTGSGGLSDAIAKFFGIAPDGDMSPSGVPLLFGLSLRKWAHVCAYILLGGTMTLFFASLIVRRTTMDYVFAGIVSFAACVAYAASDELHQLLIPGRTGSLTDVMIDSCGIAAAIPVTLGIWYLAAYLHARRHANKT